MSLMWDEEQLSNSGKTIIEYIGENLHLIMRHLGYLIT